MKLKLFFETSGNRNTKFDTFEANVNEWLADHPNIVIENTSFLSQPNAAWSHLALAVWYNREVGTEQWKKPAHNGQYVLPTRYLDDRTSTVWENHAYRRSRRPTTSLRGVREPALCATTPLSSGPSLK
jgi:hypothetical protein